MSKNREYDEGLPTLRYTVTELSGNPLFPSPVGTAPLPTAPVASQGLTADMGKASQLGANDIGKENAVTAHIGEENDGITYNVPNFIKNTDSETADTRGRTYGTTLHEFMQTIDFANPVIDKQFEAKINNFLKTDLYKRIQNAEKIEREREFFVSLKGINLPKGVNKDVNKNGFLMGIIDLIVHEEDGVTLVDYKSDKVKTEDELVKRHRLQLEIYKAVLEKIQTKPIKDVLIYSFYLNKEIKVSG
jgi:ATP-dependent exoDNAse (exonuclease V) beta subunit